MKRWKKVTRAAADRCTQYHIKKCTHDATAQPPDESNHTTDCTSNQTLRILSMDIIMVFLQFFHIILHELCSAVIAQHLSCIFTTSHTKGIATIAAQILAAPCAVAYHPLSSGW